jgi:hypothetical protein
LRLNLNVKWTALQHDLLRANPLSTLAAKRVPDTNAKLTVDDASLLLHLLLYFIGILTFYFSMILNAFYWVQNTNLL